MYQMAFYSAAVCVFFKLELNSGHSYAKGKLILIDRIQKIEELNS